MSSFSRMVFLALIALAGSAVSSGTPAWAQFKFCPPTSTGTNKDGQPFTILQIQQIAGNCTNPNLAGASAGAVTASQAIGNYEGASTLTETLSAGQAIGERQNAPLTCLPDEVLVDGICKPRPALAPLPRAAAAPALPGAPATPAHAASAARSIVKSTIPTGDPSFGKATAQVPPPIFDQSFRIGSWAQGFGDYEHRSGSQNILFNCCTNPVIQSQPIPMTIDASSTASSGGFVGGVDATRRGLTGPQDGFVAGVLGGYIWNNITVNTSALSSDPTKVANGSNRTTAHVNGPSLGLYGVYFNGPFSNDLSIRNDFLSLSENWSGILGFGTCNCQQAAQVNGFVSDPNQVKSPPPSGNITQIGYPNPAFGSGSANLNQFTVYDNVNYKIPLNGGLSITPTAGFLYLNSTYSSSAAELGLANGYIVRFQGGAKLRVDSRLGDTRVTTLLTGLVFDDVIVHGNNIQSGSFGPTGGILSDQGKVQGEAIASITFDLGRGLSASVQGDVYGGQNIFGAGGNATIRIQW